MRVFIVLTVILFKVFCGTAQVKIIFDTDFGGDADDLGALVMLHNLHNKGECELLGIASWSNEQYVIPAMDAVNRFYGNPDIPIGIRSKDSHYQYWNYNKPIADNLPHELSNNDVPLALNLYRKILSEQVDKSVTVVTVGPLKNIMDLIQSKPDKYSDLSGKKLIEKKVKEFVIMGGHFPSGENEWNFNGNMPGVTKFVLENLTVPVIFSGFEIGAAIKSGAVFSKLDKNHPLYVGWRHFSEHAPWMKEYYTGEILNNSTFDQTAVLYAVRGGVGKYWEIVDNGYCVAKENGDNYWIEGDKYNHAYLVLKRDPEEMARLIEAVMLNEFLKTD
ncbi:MAG: nucleoside hydrolase [Mariniphaga sp.]|nr:nucleoside hydrolase [Mariniphaga sp.]